MKKKKKSMEEKRGWERKGANILGNFFNKTIANVARPRRKKEIQRKNGNYGEK